MSREATELLKSALRLSMAERTELAGALIDSLDDAEDETVEAAWDREAARRMSELDSGELKTISLEEARRRISSAA